MILRVLIFAVAFMVAVVIAPSDASANSAELLIRSGIVQCGAREELNYACEYDERCCELKDLFWDGVEIEDDAYEVSDVPDDQAVIEAIRDQRDIIIDDLQSVSLQ